VLSNSQYSNPLLPPAVFQLTPFSVSFTYLSRRDCESYVTFHSLGEDYINRHGRVLAQVTPRIIEHVGEREISGLRTVHDYADSRMKAVTTASTTDRNSSLSREVHIVTSLSRPQRLLIDEVDGSSATSAIKLFDIPSQTFTNSDLIEFVRRTKES